MLIDTKTMHFYRWTNAICIVVQFNKCLYFYIYKKLCDSNVVIIKGKVGF
jgi:hypothetical protein